MGRKRRAGGQLATSPYVDDVVRRWDTPRKCALFGLDGPDSMTSGSDVVEAQIHRDSVLDRVRRILLGLRNGPALLRRQFPDIRENLAGNNISKCLRV